MKLLTLDDWPFAARLLLELGQLQAASRGHAYTTPAHLLQAVLEMRPVRRILGDQVTSLDALATRALLVAQRGAGKQATLDPPLLRVVQGGSGGSSAAFLRACWVSTPLLEKGASVLSAHTEAIATLLDVSTLREALADPSTKPTMSVLPHLALAVAGAAKRGHRVVTARHAILAWLESLDKVLAKKELPRLTDEVAKMESLVIQTTARRDEGQKTLVYEAKLVGAVAAALTPAGDGPATKRFVVDCVEGDAALDFARDAMRAAVERLGAKE